MRSVRSARAAPSYRAFPASSPGVEGAPEMELALDVFQPRPTQLVALRREDKEVFDALQAWWHFRNGVRLKQWELFSLLLSDALENPGGRFAEARFVAPRRAT